MLTNKQRVFVTEYLKTWNATGAAISAGYSPKSASEIGRENLRKPQIAAEIQACLEEHVMTSEETLSLLSDIARNMGTRYLKSDGSIDLKSLLADGLGHVVKGVKETRWGLNIEFYDSQAALAVIARHYKLFSDQTALEGTIRVEGLETLLDRIYGDSKTNIEIGKEA